MSATLPTKKLKSPFNFVLNLLKRSMTKEPMKPRIDIVPRKMEKGNMGMEVWDEDV